MADYPLADDTWDDAEFEAIQQVLASRHFTMGARVAEFERSFAEVVGSKHAVMVNSGSSANLIAVAALTLRKHNPLQRGAEVIVPAVSWATTYAPLQQYGLRLKFVDIDLDTLNYDLEALRAAVSDQTRAVVAVNLLGNPNDFDEINRLIGSRPIVLLEDNCEALGAVYRERQAGTFGELGTFSTFFSHHIATMEGGLVVTDDDELHQLLLCLRAHGWTRHLPAPNLVTDRRESPFHESFRFVLPGYNVRPVEMSGAVGIEQLKKLPRFVEQRRVNARYFLDRFGNSPDFYVQREIGRSSWFGFSLIIRPESELVRADVVQRLQEHGVECRPIVTGNFAKSEVMRFCDFEISGSLANADRLHDHGFFVGNHSTDLRAQLDLLASVLSRVPAGGTFRRGSVGAKASTQRPRSSRR